MNALWDFPAWYMQQIEAGLWTLKDYHDFDYIRVSLSLAQIGWLTLMQLVLQALVFLSISAILRYFRKIRETYEPLKGLNSEGEIYNALLGRVTGGGKLSREEWKIFHKGYPPEKGILENKLENSLKTNNIGILLGGMLAVSFHQGVVLTIDSFHPVYLFLIVPFVAGLIIFSICLTRFVTLKRIKRMNKRKKSKEEKRQERESTEGFGASKTTTIFTSSQPAQCDCILPLPSGLLFCIAIVFIPTKAKQDSGSKKN
jgi:hypothetical protein